MAAFVGGQMFISVDGQRLLAKGNFSWNPGGLKHDMIVGEDGPHGIKGTPTAPYIEGAITIKGVEVTAIKAITNATVTLELIDGRVVVLNEAAYTGDGTASTQEGEMAVRFDGMNCTEIPKEAA